jgi:hypothetical protein
MKTSQVVEIEIEFQTRTIISVYSFKGIVFVANTSALNEATSSALSQTVMIKFWFMDKSNMTDHLQELLEAARKAPFTDEEREAQRRSFAYGNAKIENDRITREMVDELDELAKAELRAQ